MKKYLIALTTILLLLGTALTTTATAQTDGSVDKVILTSTENYPDALVASAPASKLGIPVLLTNKEEIPEETRSSLEEYDPQEIILVGGPAVISENLEADLESEGYQVTRLWGMSRYGTANEVAEHFWAEGSQRALLVQNNFGSGSELLAQAKELARQQELPLFLVPEDKLPAEVLAQMNDLGVKQVTAVGPNLDPVKEGLEQAEMEMEQRFNGSQQQIKQKIRQQVSANLTSHSELVVVAAANFGHTISAPNLPNSASFIVSSEEEIEDAITAIQERNITEVKVVGQPDLASQIADELKNETEANVRLVSGRGNNMAERAVNLAHNLTARDQVKNRFREQAKRKIQKWQQKMEQAKDRISGKANKTLTRAKLMASNMTEEAKSLLEEANGSCRQGDWTKCREMAQKAMSEARKRGWQQTERQAERVRQRIEQETESLEEKVQEMTETNQEFGELMQQNMTVKERLGVINEFKNQHRQQVRSVMQQATEAMRGSAAADEKQGEEGETKEGEASGVRDYKARRGAEAVGNAMREVGKSVGGGGRASGETPTSSDTDSTESGSSGSEDSEEDTTGGSGGELEDTNTTSDSGSAAGSLG